jgi:hypothetical protein
MRVRRTQQYVVVRHAKVGRQTRKNPVAKIFENAD